MSSFSFKKVLMTFMILGAMGSTIGAGTFASFNATTTTGATFASGSVVLKGTNDSTATTCYSTGSPSGNTDSNAGTCAALFTSSNASIKRPGDVAQVDLSLENAGNLSGTVNGIMPSAASCTDGNVSGANYNGSASACQNIQLAIQEYTSSARTTTSVCRYGAGASAVITGTALTSITIDNTSNKFNLTVDGVPYSDITLTNATYTPATLATEVQTKIRAATSGGELAAATTDGKLQLSSGTTGVTSAITIATPTAGAGASALAKLGFTTGTTSSGNQQTCSLSAANPDNTHTLSNFLAAYPTSSPGVDMGALSPSGVRYYRIQMLLPTGADNLLQGRKATFSLTWTLVQS